MVYYIIINILKEFYCTIKYKIGLQNIFWSSVVTFVTYDKK